MRASAIALLLLLAGRPSVAAAQSAREPDRITIQIDAGGQLSSSAFEATTTRPVYVETATIATSYRIGRGLLGDAGVAVRVGGQFGLGVTVSSFMTKSDGEISASIPHPFFFQTPQNRADCGIFHWALRSKRFTASFCGNWPMSPDVVHDLLLHLSQIF